MTCWDAVGWHSKISVPGRVTSTATKNEKFETRIYELGAQYSSSFAPVTETAANNNYIYRLVDNNLDGSLADQLTLACNSVGAMWQSHGLTTSFWRDTTYPKSGILFSDTTYWSPSFNFPAGAGTVTAYNIDFKDIEISWDTQNISNSVIVRNTMPRNIITGTTGTLLYKDAPVAARSLDVITPIYESVDATSQTNYGKRQASFDTNVYPYRTTDSDGTYLTYNNANDSGFEYHAVMEPSGVGVNLRYSTVTPETGGYCLDVVTTTSGSSYTVYPGDPNGYSLATLPLANANCYRLSFRTAQANARYTRGIQYLDSNNSVLLTQTSAVITPTLNTWQQTTASFMDYTTIPAGTVAWRPILTITHATGSFTVGTTIAKLDNIYINENMQAIATFDGDTASNNSFVMSWDGAPGQSRSWRIRNVLDNIGSAAITKWKDTRLAPRYLEFNARSLVQDYSAISRIVALARIDIRFQGTSYVAWINRVRFEIDTENVMVKLDLGTRPPTWY